MDTSAEEMSRKYIGYFTGVSKFRRLPADYVRYCISSFEVFAERANWNTGIAERGHDVNDLFYWEHRVGMWASASMNGFNGACRSMVGYNSRTMFEAAFGLKAEERFTKELLIQLARRYNPAIGDVRWTPPNSETQLASRFPHQLWLPRPSRDQGQVIKHMRVFCKERGLRFKIHLGGRTDRMRWCFSNANDADIFLAEFGGERKLI